MAKCQGTKLEVVGEEDSKRKTKSACNSAKNSPRMDGCSNQASSCPATPSQNGGRKIHISSQILKTLPNSDIEGPQQEMNEIKPDQRPSNGFETKVEILPSRDKPAKISIADDKDKPDLGRLRNYQIKFIKKGIPNIDPKDNTVQRILMKKRDLKISSLWVCQRKKDGTPRSAIAWAFSTLVTFLCLIFPLLSFSSDVAFYVTCSDHYNHTAEVLEEVRNRQEKESTVVATPFPITIEVWGNNQPLNDAGTQDAASHVSSEPREPLQVRDRRSLYDIGLRRDYRNPVMATNHNIPVGIESNEPLTRMFPSFFPTSSLRGSATQRPDNLADKDEHPESVIILKDPSSPRETNFEFEVQERNATSCAPVDEILRYMKSDKAAEELEAHRHVTIDVFEPVFILGSFPSLILCILTRLVILVTGHKNFLSAYVVNMACMPLQLITGALGVHSASYHLGRLGFECWHCAAKADCSDMAPLWWLHDGVTKTLLVSIVTKILDGMAGGVVLFIVIIRLLWPEGGHATFWWNTIRGFVIFAAFVACVTISPLLVITPAMSVLRLEFMELATPFPGRGTIFITLTVLMSLGLAAWGLSFAFLLLYVTYSMYMYCRARTIDK